MKFILNQYGCDEFQVVFDDLISSEN